MSVGYGFACAQRTDGQVHCWGRNDLLQLGHTKNDFPDENCGLASAVPCNSTPNPVLSLQGQQAAAVVAGYGFACALIASGNVECWGDDTELGNDPTDNVVAHAVPVLDEDGGPFFADDVRTGYIFACSSKAGTLYCWGPTRTASSPTTASPPASRSPKRPP